MLDFSYSKANSGNPAVNVRYDFAVIFRYEVVAPISLAAV